MPSCHAAALAGWLPCRRPAPHPVSLLIHACRAFCPLDPVCTPYMNLLIYCVPCWAGDCAPPLVPLALLVPHCALAATAYPVIFPHTIRCCTPQHPLLYLLQDPPSVECARFGALECEGWCTAAGALAMSWSWNCQSSAYTSAATLLSHERVWLLLGDIVSHGTACPARAAFHLKVAGVLLETDPPGPLPCPAAPPPHSPHTDSQALWQSVQGPGKWRVPRECCRLRSCLLIVADARCLPTPSPPAEWPPAQPWGLPPSTSTTSTSASATRCVRRRRWAVRAPAKAPRLVSLAVPLVDSPSPPFGPLLLEPSFWAPDLGCHSNVALLPCDTHTGRRSSWRARARWRACNRACRARHPGAADGHSAGEGSGPRGYCMLLVSLRACTIRGGTCGSPSHLLSPPLRVPAGHAANSERRSGARPRHHHHHPHHHPQLAGCVVRTQHALGPACMDDCSVAMRTPHQGSCTACLGSAWGAASTATACRAHAVDAVTHDQGLARPRLLGTCDRSRVVACCKMHWAGVVPSISEPALGGRCGNSACMRGQSFSPPLLDNIRCCTCAMHHSEDHHSCVNQSGKERAGVTFNAARAAGDQRAQHTA